MKKRCPSCGRSRRLDKRYYNNSSRTNGKQDECIDCQKSRNGEASKTEKYKKMKRVANKNWRRRNREHVSNYNASYYEKNKERIMSRRNTESIVIIENGSKKNINKDSSNKKQNYIPDIVINPRRNL